jgi:hypothetical protein
MSHISKLNLAYLARCTPVPSMSGLARKLHVLTTETALCREIAVKMLWPGRQVPAIRGAIHDTQRKPTAQSFSSSRA